MSWIRVVSPNKAEGRLNEFYSRFSSGGEVDNITRVDSLRPHTLEGHTALYKSVLHHPRHKLSKVFAECIGVLVSTINGCQYCVAHHSRGARKANPERSEELLSALKHKIFDEAFSSAEKTALEYAATLTESPTKIDLKFIDTLRDLGWSDGETLETNQITSYFAYANRVVLGLGVKPEREKRKENDGGYFRKET